MVCIQGILQVWLRLIFLAGFVMYENPELVFDLIMGPDLYDVYLAMMLLSAVILVVIELEPRWYNPWWVRRKKKKLYKYLSRMKLLMLLIEYWNADKWRCAPTPFRWGHNGPIKNKSYCPICYANTEGGAKVKNKGAWVPYPRTTVGEGVQGGVTHEGVPTASECVMATGCDPGDDNPAEHTVYTLLRPTIFQARYWVIPDGHEQSCLLLHVSPFIHVCVIGALPRRLCRGVKGKIPVTGKGIMKIKLQADGGIAQKS
jgi:hypothetical protein